MKMFYTSLSFVILLWFGFNKRILDCFAKINFNRMQINKNFVLVRRSKELVHFNMLKTYLNRFSPQFFIIRNQHQSFLAFWLSSYYRVNLEVIILIIFYETSHYAIFYKFVYTLYFKKLKIKLYKIIYYT